MIGKKALIDLCIKHGVEHDVNKRWETGMDHHPEAEVLARAIGNVDFHLCNDQGDWNFGGDGDNGESLLYSMDIIFELRDKGVDINSLT